MTSTAPLTTPLTTPPAMPPDRGVCTNLPEACGLAARRQPQPLTDGAGRCSECGSALMLPAAPAAAASPAAARRWLLPVLVCGLGYWPVKYVLSLSNNEEKT